MPLIEKVPGLRATSSSRSTSTYAGDDLVVVTRMEFDDRAALEAGMASDEMRVAGRNLREIAPGLLTLVALDERWFVTVHYDVDGRRGDRPARSAGGLQRARPAHPRGHPRLVPAGIGGSLASASWS